MCTSPAMPYVDCDQTTQIFRGYEIDLFRETAYRMQLLETDDYRFTCWGWSDMVADMYKNATSGRTCDLTAACQIMSPAKYAAGLHFHLPSLSTGLAMAVRSLNHSFSSKILSVACLKGRTTSASLQNKSCSLNSLHSQWPIGLCSCVWREFQVLLRCSALN